MSDKNIYQRLLAVMEAVGYIQKEDKKVNNQYTFVSHDAVSAKLRPALIANGILAVPSVKASSQDGNMTKVTMQVTFVNVDKPEDRVEVESFGYGIDPQDKGPGKAMSYAVKYALLKVFSLETGDDPERDNIPHHPACLSESELADFKLALREADDEESLLKIGNGIAGSKASDKQKAELSAEYSKRRKALKQPVTA